MPGHVRQGLAQHGQQVLQHRTPGSRIQPAVQPYRGSEAQRPGHLLDQAEDLSPAAGRLRLAVRLE
jgi:hypothetical protein